jgi:hypothetical protein
MTAGKFRRDFWKEGEIFMKTCVVEVSIDQSQKNDLGGQWVNGRTTVFLKPVYPLFAGKWDSKRQVDIASSAGSDHAVYVWKRPLWGSNTLLVISQGYEGDTSDKTHLRFDAFESMKVNAGGEGLFFFRGEEWNIYWEIARLE